ncbi:LOW QUALITY PROTEIN: hypothetical protein ACHAW6_013884 [Cyclotella cf. meneghiniana]
MQLEQPTQTVITPGYTIFGDNAFVESNYMSIPIPEHKNKDSYNFYFYQLCITMKQAFGILVHQFGILRAPLSISIKRCPLLSCVL